MKRDSSTIIWMGIFIVLWIYKVMQNSYIFYSIWTYRNRIERVHFTLIHIVMTMFVIASLFYNPFVIIILLFSDSLINITWLCRLILLLTKLMMMMLPLTILISAVWISIQIIFPLKSKRWTNSSTIRSSFLIVGSIFTPLVLIPGFIDPHIHHCNEPLTFPNKYHGIINVNCFHVPAMLTFIACICLIFRTTRHYNQKRLDSESENQRYHQNMKHIKRSFTAILFFTCAKLTITVTTFNLLLIYDVFFNHLFLLQILVSLGANFHMICVPLALCRNKHIRRIILRSIKKDFKRVSGKGSSSETQDSIRSQNTSC